MYVSVFFFFFSSRRRHTRCSRDWSSDVCSSDLEHMQRMADAMEKHYGVGGAALDFYDVHVEVEGDHAERAVRILSKLAVTDEEQARGRLALRRAITARRICADGMLEGFEGRARG